MLRGSNFQVVRKIRDMFKNASAMKKVETVKHNEKVEITKFD